ncbi:MAG: hypothetical protein LBJ73_03090 [Rickettsiales bacterium]|jgi:hypothetical protein|nr:hypothetical protein [Rickettsiales bacterium]
MDDIEANKMGFGFKNVPFIMEKKTVDFIVDGYIVDTNAAQPEAPQDARAKFTDAQNMLGKYPRGMAVNGK